MEQVVNQMEDHDEDNDGIDEEFDYKKVKSQSSCKLEDIKGFTFGGFSSRFWMLRKHINSMDREALKTIPFFCWDCIVLEQQFRSVDLVIRDEYQMEMFLKFLIWELRTIDGKRMSADPIVKKIMKSGKNKEMQQHEIEYQIFKSTLARYKIIKFRSKLSFTALERGLTIKEIFHIAILKAYQVQVAQGDFADDFRYT